MVDSFSIAKLEGLLANRTVWIWLSPEGKLAVKQVFEKDAFRVHVESVGELGLWLRPAKPGNTLLLLKWSYLACAQLDVEPAKTEQIVTNERVQ
jgi:hypothetical protein